MKIKDRVLRCTHNCFQWCCFSSVYKGYHFFLLIWRCLGIKYGVHIILRTHYFWRFCDFFYWIKIWIYLWNNLHKISLVIYFLEESWKYETYQTFRLHKYANVLELPIVDIAAVLYVACKYLLSLSLGIPFLLYILLCILGKWQHKLNCCFHS